MASNIETVGDRFQNWGRLTLGWQVQPNPVAPKPLFAFFTIPDLLKQLIVDDAEQQARVTTLMRSYWRASLETETTPKEDEPQKSDSFERKAAAKFSLLINEAFHPKPLDYVRHRTEVEAAIFASLPSASLAASTTATVRARPSAAKTAAPAVATLVPQAPPVASALAVHPEPIRPQVRRKRSSF